MDVKKLKALLIGGSRKSSLLSNRLRKNRCDCWFAISRQEVWKLLDDQSFDLVLGPIRLNNDDSLYPLISRLDGSDTTLFYSQAVEDSCLWLPALRWGVNCFGTAALRSSEFVTVLDETIQEIQSIMRMAVELQPPAVSRFSSSIVTVPLSQGVSFSAIPVFAKTQGLVASKVLG
jgi:hypothetical protein